MMPILRSLRLALIYPHPPAPSAHADGIAGEVHDRFRVAAHVHEIEGHDSNANTAAA